MTDQRDEGPAKPAQGVERASGAVPGLISRRGVISGASAALPTILTLRSGSVLANTSNNFIGRDIDGGEEPVLCLNQDTIPGPELNNPNLINLGSSPAADVIQMPSALQYRIQGQGGYVFTGPAAACDKINDPKFQVKYDGDWRAMNTAVQPQNPGICVSSQATGSFGGRLTRRPITDYLQL